MRSLTMIAAMAAGGLVAAATPASAQNAMQVCGAKYQAAKKAGQLPAGQTWNQYLAQCRAGLTKPAAAAAPVAAKPAMPATPVRTAAVSKVATAPRVPGQRTPGQIASAQREKQCGAEWRTAKAAGKTGTMTWPQYWSACSKRLKG